MSEQADLQTLREAGINNVGALVAAAASFLREHPLNIVPPVANALSVQEEQFLIQGGAYARQALGESDVSTNLAVVTGEYSQMLATAMSQQEVAEFLGVGTSRVRQRLADGTLYSLPSKEGRVYPRFQFGKENTLPGLEQVLAVLNPEAHPVAIQRFFLTISNDLESSTLERPLSPRDWLLSGHSPEPVRLLAMDI